MHQLATTVNTTWHHLYLSTGMGTTLFPAKKQAMNTPTSKTLVIYFHSYICLGMMLIANRNAVKFGTG